ncbi:MAG: hypothetical protein E3J35_10005 [Methanomassiliicoccales archaeon]|nr:MAG: hypothetical protein E3J35_10005 [Methanomassiliicoccales archaeon]
MKRIERFWASRFERGLTRDELAFFAEVHEWVPKLVKEVVERTIKSRSDGEPGESDFFASPPTYYHARMLVRTVLENGFVRYARHTGKVYESVDMMPDKAAIINFLERHLLESEEEAQLRYGTFQYFCAIAASSAERALSWVLLGKSALNLLGDVAKHRFYENWKGKRYEDWRGKGIGGEIHIIVEFWTLFLIFYIMWSDNPQIRKDPKVLKMIVAAFIDIAKIRIC